MTEPNRILGASEVELTLGGAPFRAMVWLGVVDGRTSCVGIDIRAFDETVSADGGPVTSSMTPLPGWAPLTSRRIRELRLDEAVTEARTDLRSPIADALKDPTLDRGDPVAQDAAAWVEALGNEAGPRRSGRPPTLTDRDLELVADVYDTHLRAGGRSPVVAVRRALEEQGASIGGPEGHITIGQARAAVRRARRLGLIKQNPRKDTSDG